MMKPQPPEYTAFENLLREVIQVPHSELKDKLDAERQKKQQKRPKTSDASREDEQTD